MPSHPSRARPARQHVRLCIPGYTVRTKRWIEVDGRFAIGEGGGDLLRAVEALGSLAAAAREVGWSYRHAWGYVRRAEDVLGVALLAAKPGRGGSKGSALTRAAHDVLASMM